MAETFYKTVRLVPAEGAKRLDIPAEAPIFLLPVSDLPRFCLL